MPTIVGGCCSRCVSRCTAGIRKHWHLLVALVLGQFLSLMLCGTGLTSSLLEVRYSIAVPTSQAFINYILLGMVFGVWLALNKKFPTILKENWWKYVILGVIDVEGNYLIILAYKYTTLTSIQLLDSFSIACVMVLSFIFLRTRYKVINFMGVLLSLIGIVSLVLADLEVSHLNQASDQLKGDLLCLGGAVLYAIGNVAQEYLVKNHSISEYLGLLGVSASIVSAIQLLILERPTLIRIDWNMDIILLFLVFGVCMFLFYSVMTVVMTLSSAVVVNLSLLTADVYTLFLGLFLFHYKFSLFYILAFILVICGVFIYNLKPPTKARQSTNTESQDKDKSHDRKGDGTASRGGGGLLETQTIDMSTHSRTRSSSVGGLYGSIESEPSKPSNSAISEHAVKP